MSDHTPVSGPQAMTPSEAFVETLAANGVTDMFGIMGSAFMDAMDIFAPAGIRLDPGRARAGRRPYGRRLCARLRPPRRGHRPERPRHQQLRHRDRRGLLGAQPGGDDHARDGHDGHGPGRLPGSQAAADVPGVHQVPGPRHTTRAHGRVHRPLLRPRASPRWDRPSSTSRATTSTARSRPRSRSRSASTAAPAASKSLNEAAELLAQREVPGHHLRRRRRHGRCDRGVQGARRAARRAGRQQLPAQRLVPRQPPAVVRPARLPGLQGGDEADRPGRRGDRARLALGPFGTLPQHGMDYWPKNAKIIQIDADHKMLGPGEEDHRRHLRRREGRGRRAHAAPRRQARSPATPRARSAPRQIAAEKAAWEKELDELDPRARPVQPRHDRGAEGRAQPAAAPSCIRARCCASWKRRCRRT